MRIIVNIIPVAWPFKRPQTELPRLGAYDLRQPG